jgi:hypothetical protein
MNATAAPEPESSLRGALEEAQAIVSDTLAVEPETFNTTKEKSNELL